MAKFKNYYEILPGKFCMLNSFKSWKPGQNIEVSKESDRFYSEKILLNLKAYADKIPFDSEYHQSYYNKNYTTYRRPLDRFLERNSYKYKLVMKITNNPNTYEDTFSYDIIKNEKVQNLGDFVSDPDKAKWTSNKIQEVDTIVDTGSQIINNETDTLKWFFDKLNEFINNTAPAPTNPTNHIGNSRENLQELKEDEEETIAKLMQKKNMKKKRPFFSFSYTLHTILREDLAGGTGRNWSHFLASYIARYKRDGANIGADLRILLEANNLKDFDTSLAPKPLCEEFMKKAPILSAIFVDFYLNEEEYMLRQLMTCIEEYK